MLGAGSGQQPARNSSGNVAAYERNAERVREKERENQWEITPTVAVVAAVAAGSWEEATGYVHYFVGKNRQVWENKTDTGSGGDLYDDPRSNRRHILPLLSILSRFGNVALLRYQCQSYP